VEVDGHQLPDEDWRIEKMERSSAGLRATVVNARAGLSAIVQCRPGRGNELLWAMTLRNDGTAPVTATLLFPLLRGVQLGNAGDTWYLFGKRGGIINRADLSLREPLGDSHPLQVDGFFSPRSGVALACMTHDTVAQHHFLRMAKSAAGGAWSRNIISGSGAGSSFTATGGGPECARGRLESHFRRPTAAGWAPGSNRRRPSPCGKRTFAFAAKNAHYEAFNDARARGDIMTPVERTRKYLGQCDYMHLFGWAASRKFGDWGDYDHYDETVGGQVWFSDQIKQAQAQGVGVGPLSGWLSKLR